MQFLTVQGVPFLSTEPLLTETFVKNYGVAFRFYRPWRQGGEMGSASGGLRLY